MAMFGGRMLFGTHSGGREGTRQTNEEDLAACHVLCQVNLLRREALVKLDVCGDLEADALLISSTGRRQKEEREHWQLMQSPLPAPSKAPLHSAALHIADFDLN